MGETLAETRLEVAAQRESVEETAEQLRASIRRAVDIPAKLRENPALFGSLAAGTAFLVVGGPRRLLRAARQRVRPAHPDQAYRTLPGALQGWVDAATATLGSGRDEARRTMSEELLRWRNEPRSKKARRELAREIVDGPPSGSRTFWRTAEAFATVVSAAVARRAVARLLSGDRPMEAAAELSPAHGTGDGTEGVSRPTYSGWSASARSER
jgi:hypothetical protein